MEDNETKATHINGVVGFLAVKAKRSDEASPKNIGVDEWPASTRPSRSTIGYYEVYCKKKTVMATRETSQEYTVTWVSVLMGLLPELTSPRTTSSVAAVSVVETLMINGTY